MMWRNFVLSVLPNIRRPDKCQVVVLVPDGGAGAPYPAYKFA